MEKLQTRTEHSRSLEDAETFRALDTLRQVGLLIPLEEVETFHGRLGSAAEENEWGVIPSFANANNDSGNSNVNGRPTLYTGEHEIARDFAKTRGQDTVGQLYSAEFEKRVAHYTPEQRAEWLGRLNAKQTARWNSLNPEQQSNYPTWGSPITEDELDRAYRVRVEAMRLAILGHDTGKPESAARGDKRNQKQYNLAQAEDFFTKVGVDDKEKGLLLAMIGDGEDLSFLIHVRGAGEDVKQQMRSHATKTLQEFYGREDISESEIGSFTEMCRVLLVCDGGAYTSMAVTNRAGVGRFRNAPSFNSTYAQPVGPTRRGIKIREVGERSASSDLTPKA